MNLLIIQLSPPPVTSSLLGPNIPLNILFSNPLMFTDQAAQAYKTTGKNYSSVYLNIYIFKQQMGGYKNKNVSQ
jgi:hypothetical protein